jgi:hypothetical protein
MMDDGVIVVDRRKKCIATNEGRTRSQNMEISRCGRTKVARNVPYPTVRILYSYLSQMGRLLGDPSFWFFQHVFWLIALFAYVLEPSSTMTWQMAAQKHQYLLLLLDFISFHHSTDCTCIERT